MSGNGAAARKLRKMIHLERTYEASLEDVWEMWTTRAGIESWWGPDGFSVKVLSLDLRAGGTMVYAMTASAPPQIEFMKKAGMPLTTETRVTFTEVDPPRRLAFTQFADFIPGVTPYDVATLVELTRAGDRVKVSLSIEAMHDETWTERAVMGWKNELERLAQALDA